MEHYNTIFKVVKIDISVLSVNHLWDMGRAIRPEIRGKIIAYHQAGKPHKWIVRETATSIASVKRFIRSYRNDLPYGLLPQGVPVAKKQVDAC